VRTSKGGHGGDGRLECSGGIGQGESRKGLKQRRERMAEGRRRFGGVW